MFKQNAIVLSQKTRQKSVGNMCLVLQSAKQNVCKMRVSSQNEKQNLRAKCAVLFPRSKAKLIGELCQKSTKKQYKNLLLWVC